MTEREKHGRSEPLVIGHRGAPGYRPEHTRSSYELAFEMGADAVEPDLVATRDGVLVVRHENEISGTTDVAEHPEFADRRRTTTVDGREHTGFFTEDFDWVELQTLRARERLPRVRPRSAAFDGTEPLLRLEDLLEIVDAASERRGRQLGLVAEVKHATHFASIGLPLDELVADALASFPAEHLVVESFEETVLRQLHDRGLGGRGVYLVEKAGAAFDRVAAEGSDAPSYAEQLTSESLAAFGTSAWVRGISVDKSLLLGADGSEEQRADGAALVNLAHHSGLDVFTWTLRPENRFLTPAFRLEGSKDAFGDWRGEFQAVLETGVDGVFVDHPDLGRESVGGAA